MSSRPSTSLGAPARSAATLFPPLLAWYDRHRRTLPWRAPAGTRPDPYHVLVSELMLQQTTVATVVKRFDAFIERFPSLEALAAAPLDEVLHAWQGLGYYRRARGLHACARTVIDDHGGRLPTDPTALEALPGLGPYTAAAIASIAYARPVLAVDANVERVLARLFAVETPLPEARSALRRLAQGLAPERRPGDTVQALMDLGSMVCRPRGPACLACPLRDHCAGHASGLAAALPRKAPKRARPGRVATVFHLTRADGAVLFRRRPDQGMLAGLVELPSTPWTDEPPSAAAIDAAAPAACAWVPVAGGVRHVFTHFALELSILRGRLDDDGALREQAPLWRTPAAFGTLALPTLTRKLLAHVAGPER